MFILDNYMFMCLVIERIVELIYCHCVSVVVH